MEAKRGRDDDIDVSSRRGFDWAGHFSPVPYERDRTAPAKRSTYSSPAFPEREKRTCVTPWYHINGLERSAADAVTCHSRIRDGTNNQSAVLLDRKMKKFILVTLDYSYIYSLLESCWVLLQWRSILGSDFVSLQNTFEMVNTSRSL